MRAYGQARRRGQGFIPRLRLGRIVKSGATRALQGLGIMAYLAMVMFIALFAFGQDYFGWSDPNGKVELALVSAFVFGILCGYRAKS